MEIRVLKSGGKKEKPSRNLQKQLEIIQKSSKSAFGSKRPGVQIPPLGPESRNNLDVRGGKPRVPSCFGFFYAQNSSFTGMDVFRGVPSN